VLLDTPYFGGANTTYDAFAASIPVVTMPTHLPRGRYTQALYRVMGVEDCIAESPARYVEIALLLGMERAERERVASEIRAAAPALFEDQRAVTQFEEWIQQVMNKGRKNLST
jgi:protein O-GlcNAc transferase